MRHQKSYRIIHMYLKLFCTQIQKHTLYICTQVQKHTLDIYISTAFA